MGHRKQASKRFRSRRRSFYRYWRRIKKINKALAKSRKTNNPAK